MNLEQLIAAAKKAIEEGNLQKAEELTAKIRAIRALNEVASSGNSLTDSEREELEELRAARHRLENEPPSSKAGKPSVVVVQDEADKPKPWNSLGEQLQAIKHAYLFPHSMDVRLKKEGQKAVLGNSEGVDSDGGFLVNQDFSTEILRRVNDISVIASRVRRIPIGANANGLKINAIDETSRANGSRFGGVRGYWLAEGAPITASMPKFRQMSWNLHKLGVLLYATDELLQDSTALGAVMMDGASEEVSFLVDDAIMNGTGAGMPMGLLNSPSKIAVSGESGQAAGEILPENIFKMWSRMWARSRLNSVWFINQDIEPALYSMTFPVGTGGQPVYMPPSGVSTSPYATLLGRPLIPTEFNSTLGTEGDIVLADPTQYLLVDKGGLQAATSIHVAFLTDQTAFRWIYRVDGRGLWNQPLTPYKGSNTLSPIITLATRSG